MGFAEADGLLRPLSAFAKARIAFAGNGQVLQKAYQCVA